MQKECCISFCILGSYKVVNSAVLLQRSSYFCKLFWSQNKLISAEINVFFAVHRDKMYVCMGHFEA